MTAAQSTTTNWMPRTFQIDALEDSTFAGFAKEGIYWNGWECPFFERAEAEQILRESEANDYFWRYDETQQAFIVNSIDAPNDDESEIYEAITVEINGEQKTLYGIGAYSWVWEQAN